MQGTDATRRADRTVAIVLVGIIPGLAILLCGLLAPYRGAWDWTPIAVGGASLFAGAGALVLPRWEYKGGQHVRAREFLLQTRDKGRCKLWTRQ